MQHDLLHAKRTSGFEQRGEYFLQSFIMKSKAIKNLQLIVVMHLSLAFPGWGTLGIPGGIATFYVKVTQFSKPWDMI